MNACETYYAHEFDRGFEAGQRGDSGQEPTDCVCRDSWLAGYQYGAAMLELRSEHRAKPVIKPVTAPTNKLKTSVK